MSQTGRFVHLKQSGEVLTDEPGQKRWTPQAVRRSVERIAEVHNNAGRLGVAGFMVISGGGNVTDGYGRGNAMQQAFAGSHVAEVADIIGRRSTIDNAIVLSAALQDLNVPHVLLAAPNAAFSDLELGQVAAYNTARVQQAYDNKEVVLIAGGTGKPHQTSDTAVIELAEWQAQARPDSPVVALKATTLNGVYTSDLKLDPNAKQYARLSAAYMLDHYDRLGAVDHRCLEVLKAAGDAGHDISLQVYSAQFSILEALENPALGTTIYSRFDGEPVLA